MALPATINKMASLQALSIAPYLRFPASHQRRFQYNKNLLAKPSNVTKLFKGIQKTAEQDYAGVFVVYERGKQHEVCVVIKIEGEVMVLFVHEQTESFISNMFIEWLAFIFAV